MRHADETPQSASDEVALRLVLAFYCIMEPERARSFWLSLKDMLRFRRVSETNLDFRHNANPAQSSLQFPTRHEKIWLLEVPANAMFIPKPCLSSTIAAAMKTLGKMDD